MLRLLSSRCVFAACPEVDFGLEYTLSPPSPPPTKLYTSEGYRQAGMSLLLVLKWISGLSIPSVLNACERCHKAGASVLLVRKWVLGVSVVSDLMPVSASVKQVCLCCL